MKILEQVEESIKGLPRDELFQLVQWMKEHYEAAWDQQIEDDVTSGKLDFLAREALAEYHTGGTIPFPESNEEPRK